MIHDHSRDGTGPAIASCTRQRGYLSPILCLFRLLAADHLLQAPEEVLCEIVHDDKLLHPDHLLKLAGRQWRFFRLGTRADLQSLGQSDRLEILPVSQIPLPACSRMPLPLAFRMTASLLAITKPGVRRVPLPAYPTRTFSIPKLFAHLPSLVLRSTGKPTEQAGRQQKEAGRKKWNPEWKKNGEVGQLIGGGWVNLLSAVTGHAMQAGGHLQWWPLSPAWWFLDRTEDAGRQSAVCTQRALPEADPIRTRENFRFSAHQMALNSKDWADATSPCADHERTNTGHSGKQEYHPARSC